MVASSFVDLRTNICWFEVRCACGNKAKKDEVAAKARGNARDIGFNEFNECVDCRPTETELSLMSRIMH